MAAIFSSGCLQTLSTFPLPQLAVYQLQMFLLFCFPYFLLPPWLRVHCVTPIFCSSPSRLDPGSIDHPCFLSPSLMFLQLPCPTDRSLRHEHLLNTLASDMGENFQPEASDFWDEFKSYPRATRPIKPRISFSLFQLADWRVLSHDVTLSRSLPGVTCSSILRSLSMVRRCRLLPVTRGRFVTPLATYQSIGIFSHPTHTLRATTAIS